MAEKFFMHGMVLSSVPMGENDRRVVLLTRERGRVSAFFRGARRAKSELSAASNPFTFGTFEAFEGRNSITVVGAQISHFFENLTKDLEKVYLGSYFMEMAGYYSDENLDETDRLNLLYISLRALENPKIPDSLVRRIYEMRTFAINGEYPNVFSCFKCGKKENLRFYDREDCCMLCEDCFTEAEKSAGNRFLRIEDDLLYVIQYVLTAPLNKLYSFRLEKNLEERYTDFVQDYIRKNVLHIFKTEQFLV